MTNLLVLNVVLLAFAAGAVKTSLRMRRGQHPIVTRDRQPSNADISICYRHHSSLARTIRKVA